MPIAACYGIDPLLFLVAATSLPKTECEYEYYSGIAGAPIELFTGDVTGWLMTQIFFPTGSFMPSASGWSASG